MIKLNKKYVCLILTVFIAFFSVYFVAAKIVDKHNTISPFTSDGCSVFPDGTRQDQTLWMSCCVAHDYAYWQGGSYLQRLKADQTLKQCVENSEQPAIATIMFVGVRVGGSPLFPTSFRWGYGWGYPRWYKHVNKMK